MEDRLIYESVFAGLAKQKVKYLVAGGIAVVLHGWARFTKDLDLMIDLDDADNVLRFVSAMEKLYFRPAIPVPFASLADPSKRAQWLKEKGALVFHLYNERDPLQRIDVFLSNPVDFGKAFKRRKTLKIGSIVIQAVSLKDLIDMKERAGRTHDLEDLEILKYIRNGKKAV